MIESPPPSQKRQHERIHVDQVATIRQGIYVEKIFLFDISLKGVCFSLPIEFDITTEHPCILHFEAQLLKKLKPIEMKLDIIRKGSDRVGAAWKEIDISSLRNLAGLLEHYTQKPISLDDIQL